MLTVETFFEPGEPGVHFLSNFPVCRGRLSPHLLQISSQRLDLFG